MGARVQRCDEMPFEPTRSCPVCGRGLDPLRAPEALAFGDGIVLVCRAECAESLRATRKRGRRAAVQAQPRHAGVGERGEELTQLHALEPVPLPDTVAAPALQLVVIVVGVGLTLAPFAGGRMVALALLAGTALASLLQPRDNVAAPWPRGLLVLGASLIWAAAAFDDLSPRYLLASAAVAALATLRPWLLARGRAPLQCLANGLVSALPSEVRVPLDEVQNPREVPHRRLPAHKVHTGDVLLVSEGETLAVDGVVQTGKIGILAAPAAATPVERGPGESVLAGARVVAGAASVLATGVGDARALSRAALGSGRGGRMGSWGQRLAHPSQVLGFGVVTAVFAWLLAPSTLDAVGGLGIALWAYPLLGVTQGLELRAYAARVYATQLGMVFRDAGTLEDAGHISAAALIADGTVTEPTRLVTEVLTYGREHGLDELASLAMGLEASCEEHPIALAIAAYGHPRGLSPSPVRRASHMPGRGVTALSADGEPLAIGNRPLLLSAGVSVAVAERDAQAAEAAGRSAVFLAVGGRVRALFVIDYQLRPQARSALQTIIDLGADVALLSGDHRATVESFADKLDITHVKAELNRDERAAEVARLREAGGLVAAIGRLPQDEGALAEADVGVALNGAGGAAVDIELALASDDIVDATHALNLAHATYVRQRWVLSASLAASAVAALGAVGALGPPALWPLVVLAVDAWAVPSGQVLLARLKRVGVVGSVRSATGLARSGSTLS